MLFDSPQTTGSLQISGSLDLGPNAVINDFSLPVGTSSERPTNPSTGDIRFNTTFNQLEVYNGTIWGSISFNNQIPVQSAQVTVTAIDAEFLTPLDVEYLVIAGGGAGGGGGYNAGGGGAGGYRSSVQGESSGGGVSAESVFKPIIGTSYTVTVGAGGASSTTVGNDGSDSVFADITSIGGGGGGSHPNDPQDGRTGGSGGGGSQGGSLQGSGTVGQGFDGGGAWYAAGAGGGGAGQVGLIGSGNTPPYTGGQNAVDGGDGIQTGITGTLTYYAGGGGGGQRVAYNVPRGNGGQGGGGQGGPDPGNGGAATANTGGGGGGSGGDNSTSRTGGNGGSGVVILRYPSDFSITVGAGLTSSTSTVGVDKVTTFTAGTDTISFS